LLDAEKNWIKWNITIFANKHYIKTGFMTKKLVLSDILNKININSIWQKFSCECITQGFLNKFIKFAQNFLLSESSSLSYDRLV